MLWQEELADVLGGLIHCFSRVEVAMRFISAFFQTQVREWYGIDRLRLDKFLMVRMFCKWWLGLRLCDMVILLYLLTYEM